MPVLIQSVGIIVVVITTIAIFSPQTMRQMVQYLRQGNRLYVAAGVRLALGILLIWASFSCAVTWVVFTVGLLALASGGVAVGLGMPRMQAFIDWWLAKADNALRGMAAISFILGAALIYAA